MRIGVLGAGGVGGYFGGRLARAGHEVAFIARGAHLVAIRDAGLHVHSIAGDFLVAPAWATDDAASVGPVDLLIVAVKSWQLPDAVAAAGSLVGPGTVVLPLLNGVEAADELAAAFGRERVLGGLCRIIASIERPGHIRHAAAEPIVLLGELDDARTERVERLRGVFERAGFAAEAPPHIHVGLWEKLMMIATWGGIGAVTRAPIGVWRSLPGTRAMARAGLDEVAAVARARGVPLAPDRVAATLAFMDEVTPEGTTSMQRDLRDGRRSELEALNGAVVRLGAAAGVPTPTHTFLYHSLLPQERAARGLRAAGEPHLPGATV